MNEFRLSGWVASILYRVYRLLLVAYPREFRQAYGEKMASLFYDQCRAERPRGGTAGLLKLGLHMLADLGTSVLRERKAAGWSEPGTEGFWTKEYGRGFLSEALLFVCMAASVLSLYSLLGRYFPASGGEGPLTGELDWLLLAPMVIFWSVAVPFVQRGLMSRLFRARPRFRFVTMNKPVFGWVRAKGHKFKRGEFVLVHAVSFVASWVVFPAYVILAPFGEYSVVVPLTGVAMGVSLYYLLWYSIPVLLKPGGSLVEELEEEGAVRFYVPS